MPRLNSFPPILLTPPSPTSIASQSSCSSIPHFSPYQASLFLHHLQCGICLKLLDDPLTLPCGFSLCRRCLPRMRKRRFISYPPHNPNRSLRFICPFSGWPQGPSHTEHVLGDCAVDVLLAKLMDVVRDKLREAEVSLSAMLKENGGAYTIQTGHVADPLSGVAREYPGSEDNERGVIFYDAVQPPDSPPLPLSSTVTELAGWDHSYPPLDTVATNFPSLTLHPPALTSKALNTNPSSSVSSLQEHETPTEATLDILTEHWLLSAAILWNQNNSHTNSREVAFQDVSYDLLLSLNDSTFQSLVLAIRSETDCQICYALLCDAVTTQCGHTFCRSCLRRVLDQAPYCPICRRPCVLGPDPQSGPASPNRRINGLLRLLWPEHLQSRQSAITAEGFDASSTFETPLFPCAIAFPSMPTFLHIFEPQYRLMVQRCIEGNRMFGMVLPRMLEAADDAPFTEIGTILRIVHHEVYADGRSMIETVGISRFRVLRYHYVDGYLMGTVERFDDVDIASEESQESADIMAVRLQLGLGLAGGSEGDVEEELNNDSVSPHDSARNRDGHSRHHHREDSSSQSSVSSSSSRQSLPSAHHLRGSFLMDEDDASDFATRRTHRHANTIRWQIRTYHDLDRHTTMDLMEFVSGFVRRTRAKSGGWLTEHLLRIYGEAPTDPALFPWWFASILHVAETEKYRLLKATTVRTRLKICCRWVLEWESRWPSMLCRIL